MSVMRKSDFIGLALLGFVIGCRYSAPVADFYAQKCYPGLSTVLSRGEGGAADSTRESGVCRAVYHFAA